METGIREAKNTLSKLVEAAIGGQDVYLTNRGHRVAKIVATPPLAAPNFGRGLFKHKIHLYPGWDSEAEDKRIEEAFEALNGSAAE